MINQIFNEDCFESLKRIDDNSIDMILTDPPYGTTSCYWDHKIDVQSMMNEFLRVIKDNGAIVIFSQLPFAADLINSARKFFRYEWIWEKTLAAGFLNAKKMPMRCHENILVFYKKLPLYNPQFWFSKKIPKKQTGLQASRVYAKFERKELYSSPDGKRYPRDVIFADSITTTLDEDGKFAKHLHPTQKPVELLEYFIKTYSNENELILDPFIGSGSTAIACKNLNRNFIGFELDKNYFDIAIQRLKD